MATLNQILLDAIDLSYQDYQTRLGNMDQLREWVNKLTDVDVSEYAHVYIWGTRHIEIYPYNKGAADSLALQLASNEGLVFRRRVNHKDGDIILECITDNDFHIKIESEPPAACRVKRVLVGTKTVEEYHYEVECEGDEHGND